MSGQRSLECPKCEGEMIHGILLDKSYHATLKLTWQDVPSLEESVTAHLIGHAGGEQMSVVGCRCTECGFLDLYAKRGV